MVVFALLVLAAVGAVLAFALGQPAYAWAALGCCAVAVALLVPTVLPDVRRRWSGRKQEATDGHPAADDDAPRAFRQLSGEAEADQEEADQGAPEEADRVAPEEEQAAPPAPTAPAPPESIPSDPTVVLVVPGRKRFHAEDCELLSELETEELTMEEAREEGFTPCTRCTRAIKAS